MSLLIDTDVLIDVLRATTKAQTFLSGQVGELHISVVSLAELWAGCKPGAELALEVFLKTFKKTPLTEEVAFHTARYQRLYFKKRGPILADAAIAATAYVHKLKLITRNKKDFPMRDIDILFTPY